MEIFAQATKQKLRFKTARGLLDTEGLWDLPMEAKDGYSLDGVSQTVLKELNAEATDSLVKPKSNPGRADNELRLEILKRVIQSKQVEAAALVASAGKAEERKVLEGLLAQKKTEELGKLSKEEIEKRLKEL